MIDAIRAGFVAVIMLTLPSWPSQAEGSALGLEVTASKPRYASGEPVELRLTVTNHDPSPCRLSTSAEATVQLLLVAHNTERVSPTSGRSYDEDGLAGALARSLSEVAPRASMLVTMTTIGTSDGHSLLTTTRSPAGETVTSWWPVGADGRYDLVVAYNMPQIAEPGSCAGWTNFDTVSFTIGTPPRRFPWPTIATATAAALVIIMVAIPLMRRSRR